MLACALIASGVAASSAGWSRYKLSFQKVCKVSSFRLFAELVQVYLGARPRLSVNPTGFQWEEVFEISKEQTLVAICFAAIRMLPEEQHPYDKELYKKWLWHTTQVVQKNKYLDIRTKEALAYFRDNGFSCCVLKGQGIAQLYPQPELRMPGDIDMWVVGGRQRVCAFSKSKLGRITGVTYHHIHFPIFKDVEVEAHFYPSYFAHPLHNKRFQAFCKIHRPKGRTMASDLAFNRVYILQHCFRHLCGHGVGLRQFLDYYFVLKQGFTEEEREASLHVISRLHMMRFAKAAMWVLREVFGLEDCYLLCEADGHEGRFLLSEIIQSGNMGHFETRFNWSGLTPFGRFLMNQKHNWVLLSHYPHEILCSPFFSIILYAYRKCKGLI